MNTYTITFPRRLAYPSSTKPLSTLLIVKCHDLLPLTFSHTITFDARTSLPVTRVPSCPIIIALLTPSSRPLAPYNLHIQMPICLMEETPLSLPSFVPWLLSYTPLRHPPLCNFRLLPTCLFLAPADTYRLACAAFSYRPLRNSHIASVFTLLTIHAVSTSVTNVRPFDSPGTGTRVLLFHRMSMKLTMFLLCPHCT